MSIPNFTVLKNDWNALNTKLTQIAGRVRKLDSNGDMQPPSTDGLFVDQPFNAGDFTASGAMTWTVDAADVLTFQYTLIGAALFVSFILSGTTVGGVVSTALRIRVPGGYKATVRVLTPIYLLDNGVRSIGYATISKNTTTLEVQRADIANFTASANNTDVDGQIVIPVTNRLQ